MTEGHSTVRTKQRALSGLGRTVRVPQGGTCAPSALQPYEAHLSQNAGPAFKPGPTGPGFQPTHRITSPDCRPWRDQCGSQPPPRPHHRSPPPPPRPTSTLPPTQQPPLLLLFNRTVLCVLALVRGPEPPDRLPAPVPTGTGTGTGGELLVRTRRTRGAASSSLI